MSAVFLSAKKILNLSIAAALALAGCGALPDTVGANRLTNSTVEADAKRVSSDWRDEVVYFILTDRFSNGDRSNDFNVDARDPDAYHGGDFQGIINKLPYIKNLGATTIWITPINDNKDDALIGKYWGFHGYWTKNWDAIDEHLGSEAKFKELVDTAHGMGIKVMLDIVCNHMGYDAPWTKDPAKYNWFHHNGDVKNWDDTWQVQNCDISGLPDMNTENPAVVEFFENLWSKWIERTHIDAFRVDTVKHVPLPFWSQFNRAVHRRAGKDFLILGELLNGDPGTIAPYMGAGGFDTLFDYPMYFTINDVFARGQSMRKLGHRLDQDGIYNNASLLAPFLDNHDTPRFMSVAGGDERRLRLALAFLMTMRGIPTVYQGTEIGQAGQSEADNRRDMRFGANASLTDYVSKLTHLRTSLEPLRRGRQLEMWQDDDIYGYARLSSNGEVITVLNNDDRAQERDVPLRAESKLQDGTVLVDALSGTKVQVVGRKLHIAIGPKQAQVLVPNTRRPVSR